MWLVTSIGFFSVVQKPDDEKKQTLTIRARVRADLERLRDVYLPTLGKIVEDAGTDYRYRAKAPRQDIAQALSSMMLKLDYSNFKNEVSRRQGKSRATKYGQVWQVLYDLQDEHPAQTKSQSSEMHHSDMDSGGKNLAYGGILIDAEQRILLRKPKGHYDGYVWTFPKGRPDTGESPEAAAIREVSEETGYKARIIDRLPGRFEGGTTATEYFLMSPVDKPKPFDNRETIEVKWASFDEAAQMIAMTTNRTGRARDLAVLKAAKKLLSV